MLSIQPSWSSSSYRHKLVGRESARLIEQAVADLPGKRNAVRLGAKDAALHDGRTTNNKLCRDKWK